MGIAKLYSQSGRKGLKINGITQDYYVYAGETVEKGDFVELLTGSNGAETEKQVRKATTSDIYGVAKTKGVGGDSTGHKDIVSVYRPLIITLKTDDIIPRTWTKVTAGIEYVAEDGTRLTADSIFSDSSQWYCKNACDTNSISCWQSSGKETELNNWLKLELPVEKKITKMSLIIAMSGIGYAYFTSAIIQGSNDDEIWTDLATITELEPNENTLELTMSKPDYYKYYRIYTTKTSDSAVKIYDWKVLEYEVIE